MLVGRPPFTGSAFEIMQAHTMGTVAPFRELRPDCPPELEAAVLRMLARQPEQRFPTVAEAVEAFGGYTPGTRDPLRIELARLVTPDAPTSPPGWKSLTPIPTPQPGSATPVTPQSVPAVRAQATSHPLRRSRSRATCADHSPRSRRLLVLGLAGGLATIALGALAAVSLWPGTHPGGQEQAAATSPEGALTSSAPVSGGYGRGAAPSRLPGKPTRRRWPLLPSSRHLVAPMPAVQPRTLPQPPNSPPVACSRSPWASLRSRWKWVGPWCCAARWPRGRPAIGGRMASDGSHPRRTWPQSPPSPATRLSCGCSAKARPR
jgi:hypothetical protein